MCCNDLLALRQDIIIYYVLQFDALKESLHLLEMKTSTAIAKMKTLFSEIGSHPLDGVGKVVWPKLPNTLHRIFKLPCREFLFGAVSYNVATTMYAVCYVTLYVLLLYVSH